MHSDGSVPYQRVKSLKSLIEVVDQVLLVEELSAASGMKDALLKLIRSYWRSNCFLSGGDLTLEATREARGRYVSGLQDQKKGW